MATEELFWIKVDKRGPDECWEWNAGSDKDGYGLFNVEKKQVRAHRYSYTLAHGNIPNGLLVLHTCDNPKCVNPTHLFLGTNADNMQDKARKGRGNAPRGEKHGRCKLTKSQVIEIRRLAGSTTEISLAKRFNVSFQHISDIIHFKKWAWLRGE